MYNFIINNLRWLTAGALLTFLSSFGQTYFISIFSGEIRNTFNYLMEIGDQSMGLVHLLPQS